MATTYQLSTFGRFEGLKSVGGKAMNVDRKAKEKDRKGKSEEKRLRKLLGAG